MLETPVAAWIAQLDVSDPTEAVRALGEHGAVAHEAIEPLRAIVRTDPSWRVWDAALRALARIEGDPSPSALLAFADDRSEVRYTGFELLTWRSNSPPPEAFLVEMIGSADERVRVNGFRVLRWATQAVQVSFFDDLVAGLADPDRDVRIEAALTMASRGSDGRPAIGVLTELLRDPDDYRLLAAACALEDLGELPADTVDALRPLARLDNGSLGLCAMDALNLRRPRR